MMGLIRFIAVVVFVSGFGQAYGAELSSEIKQNQLNVLFTQIDYPAQFVEKELDSGLPNTVTNTTTAINRINPIISYAPDDEIPNLNDKSYYHFDRYNRCEYHIGIGLVHNPNS